MIFVIRLFCIEDLQINGWRYSQLCKKTFDAYKKKCWLISALALIATFAELNAQRAVKSDSLFSNQTPLKVQLTYSNSELNFKTNDSTYIQSSLIFFTKNKICKNHNKKLTNIGENNVSS